MQVEFWAKTTVDDQPGISVLWTSEERARFSEDRAKAARRRRLHS